MKTSRIVTLTALLMIASTSLNAADTGKFVATDKDKTSADLVSRWVGMDGHLAKWETTNYPINDVGALNQLARLWQAKSVDVAVDRLIHAINEDQPDSPPLFACSFNDGEIAIVVRSRGQHRV